MQQDVVSVPARRFQAAIRKWNPPERARDAVGQLLAWDGALSMDSPAAAIFETWIRELPAALFGPEMGPRVDLGAVLTKLEAGPDEKALLASFDSAMTHLEKELGTDRRAWSWGKLHKVRFQHPIKGIRGAGEFSRPGDANTVNNTGGTRFMQTSGASYRQVMDVSDWDKSIMTNTPGESGNPESPHYSDLAQPWAEGKYHPMPFSRKAVEEAASERMMLLPPVQR